MTHLQMARLGQTCNNNSNFFFPLTWSDCNDPDQYSTESKISSVTPDWRGRCTRCSAWTKSTLLFFFFFLLPLSNLLRLNSNKWASQSAPSSRLWKKPISDDASPLPAAFLRAGLYFPQSPDLLPHLQVPKLQFSPLMNSTDCKWGLQI